MSHIALILSGNCKYSDVLSTINSERCPKELKEFQGLTPIIFSTLEIEKVIELELRRDDPIVSKKRLKYHSSGERKKLFLDYCLNQEADYLLLDSAFDHLDSSTRIELKDKLLSSSTFKKTLQIDKRVDNVIYKENRTYNSYINQVGYVELEELTTNHNEKKLRDLPILKNSFEIINDEIVRFENVSISIEDQPILKDISWQVKKGDFWQLIGPNGSGKTTILDMITGNSHKGYGKEFYIFGRKKGSGESVRDIKKNIGYFNPSMTELFYRNHTLEQMIISGFHDTIGLYHKASVLQEKIANTWLELVNLKGEKKKYFRKLSIAQQRLGLIIRAIIKQPPLLILDEPMEGLDADGYDIVTELINIISQETNTTILYVSHHHNKKIKPKSTFELTPSEQGSTGQIIG